jgi:hypothetical protein
MSTMMLTSPERPYKFLDFYREGDASIFFGRRHEVEILLADIIATRLVVLFARTGTGKSSVIQAGVRPRLHALDYRTTLARVGADPAASIISAVWRDGLLSEPGDKPLAETLIAVVKEQTRPIVVFVDQFEEFFLAPIAPAVRKAFLREIGQIYRTPRSGVHLVFSLREDYLAEMDVFRDDVPTIFQKESQLRLRAFTPEQAREAVEGPTRTFEPAFRYEDGVVDEIVADLPREEERILPVSVQIVCDSLWRRRDDSGTITRKLYKELRSASGILASRVVEDLGRLDVQSLLALEKLIPLLSTPDWTKQPRTLSELLTLTDIDPMTLQGVVAKLDLVHLFRIETRESQQTVEWVSDYVSALSKDMIPTLALLWLQKMRTATGSHRIARERLVAILNERAITAQMTVADWSYLLASAAGSRDTLGLWFSRASEANHDPWPMLRRILDDSATSPEDISRVLLYLGEFEEGPAIDILASQVQRGDRARTAIRALGATRSRRALEYLRPALADPELHGAALDALQSLGQTDALKLADKARKESRSWRETLFGSKSRTLTGFSGDNWDDVVRSIRSGWCIATIGGRAGLHRPAIAASLASEFGYPLEDRENFDAVLEFLTLQFGAGWQKVLSTVPEGSPHAIGGDYRALAQLPVELYVTTDPTYELERALEEEGKAPQALLHGERSGGFSVKRPLLMHMRGSIRAPETIARASAGDFAVAGSFVRSHLSMSYLQRGEVMLLATGFDYADREPDLFRRNLAGEVTLPMVVIVPPLEVSSREAEERARRYFRARAEREHISFFWGTTEQFVDELRLRFSPPNFQ